MKKFFDEYPVSLLLTGIIFFGPPFYYVLQITLSMLANGDDPVLVSLAFGIMVYVAILVITPFAPVFGVLAMVFQLIGWLAKIIFLAIRKHYRRRHNPA